MVAGRVVVFMADAAVVAIVPAAVPDMLGGVPALPAAAFHLLEQLGADLVAPAVRPAADLERFIEQVLPSNGEVQQTGEAFGRVAGAVHMDVDAAGTVCHGSLFDQRPDNVLQVLDVLVLEDGGDDFTGILLVGRDDFITALLLTADASVAHGFPGAALAVAGTVGIVGGADVTRGLAEVFCNRSGSRCTGNAGQLNLYAEVLALNRGAHTNSPFGYFLISLLAFL